MSLFLKTLYGMGFCVLVFVCFICPKAAGLELKAL